MPLGLWMGGAGGGVKSKSSCLHTPHQTEQALLKNAPAPITITDLIGGGGGSGEAPAALVVAAAILRVVRVCEGVHE